MPLPTLSDAELKQHLEQPLIAKIGTLNPDGTIRITPIWFHVSDDEIIVNTPEANPLAQNLTRNPQCTILIDSPQFPSRVAHFYGRAELESRPFTADEIARGWARYFGEGFEQAKQFAERVAAGGKRVNIRFRPERVRTIDFTKIG
jgi:PPOX class probable F420-dependent enzyme